jgi:short-subunit dehydrogenase
MPTPLNEAVVVITGASSGIGRAAAMEFAKQGSSLVLAARREEALGTLARDCEVLGARAIAVRTDVTDESQVEQLAQKAKDTFGRIDVWVNNAAVTAFGNFEELPPDVFRRVVETNFFGYVYGARAAMRRFREQGSGVLINNASMVGKAGAAYLTAYSASKWAIVGFSDALRQEVIDEDDIHVSTVLPASIDTPLFQQAANYMGRAIKPMNPTYDATTVAKAIVKLTQHPMKEVHSGGAGLAMAVQRTMNPGGFDRIAAKAVREDHFADKPAPPTPGNLWDPMPEYTGISGGWGSNVPLQAPILTVPMVMLGLTLLGGLAILGTVKVRENGHSRIDHVRKAITG